jgi:uncharacterized ferritin-like protein (DUF455 family)
MTLPGDENQPQPPVSGECRQAALQALCLSEPQAKARATQSLYAQGAAADTQARLQAPAQLPGRPQRPELRPHTAIRMPSHRQLAGRAALLHAVAHIELNAINLALDAVWRFGAMPQAYYRDWLRVASEEAAHFLMVQAHLQQLGYAYGDFPAHQGLWEMVERTQDDVLARMALVPRTLEARGLDASPPMRRKFEEAGDAQACAILDTILRDEVGHVAVGNHWYRWLCQQRGLNPLEAYPELLRRYQAPRLRPPFNLEARRAAGFDEDELLALQAQAE